jgi:N6-adenosine-specific RNA methylase IME4
MPSADGRMTSHRVRYSTIVVDPPWPYEDGWPGWSLSRDERLALPYPSMSLEEIKDLPVFSLIAPEGYVFLWTTNRYLENAFAILRYWRMVPRQTLTWCKPPRGEGPGGMFATTTEFVIAAQRIGPHSHARGQRTNGRRVDTSWFQWKRGEHSAKPDAFLDLVERVCPGPYLELFARRQRLGWDTWGDQALEHVEMPA